LAQGAGVYGPVNVYSGGQFKPGNSPGSVTTGDATWNAGGHFVVEMDDALGTPGVNWDYWNVDGDIDLLAGTSPNSRFVVQLESYDGLAVEDFDKLTDYEWPIASASDGITGFNLSEITVDWSGFDSPLQPGAYFSVAQVGNNVDLVYTVPEPGSIALLLAGALAFGIWRLRRNA
jgi:hypothetical protein